MIAGGKNWHYLAVKKLSALFRRIASENSGDFYCLNCLHLFRSKTKLYSYGNLCKNHN